MKRAGKNSNKWELPVSASFVEGETKVVRVRCVRPSWWRIWVGLPIMILVTFGLWPLFLYWSAELRLRFLYTSVELAMASHFYLTHSDNTASFSKKIRVVRKKHSGNKTPCFGFLDRDLVYYYDKEKQVIRALEFDIQHFYNVIYTTYGSGLTLKSYEENAKIYGTCRLNIRVPSLLYLCITELLDPIFFIQILSIAVWFSEGYNIYAIVIVFLIATSSILNIVLLRNHLNSVKRLGLKPYDVMVSRVVDYAKVQIKSSIIDLVPGDVFEVQDNMQVPCDCLLLDGDLLMNESTVTGENLPLKKTCIPYYERLFEYGEAEKHTLYEGSWVLKKMFREGGKAPVLALVIRTGFSTLRGQLIRGILHHNNDKLLTMRRQFYKYIFIMLLLGILGNLCSVPLYIENEEKKEELIIIILDLITVIVSPILPCCTLISLSLSLSRLKFHKISCSSPYKLLTVGSIQTACFDKTGTLTEKGMKLKGVRVFSSPSFDDDLMTMGAGGQVVFPRGREETVRDPNFRQAYEASLSLMSTCHSLIKVGELELDQLVGDPVDKEIFSFSKGEIINTNWREAASGIGVLTIFRVKSRVSEILGTSGRSPCFSIVRIFEFSSERQSMSVIALNEETSEIVLYSKGSPEKILEACAADSVSASVWSQIKHYSKEGYVILAMAFKRLSVFTATHLQVIDNSELERDMTFIGLLVYENKLKPSTLETMKTLAETSINIKIVTGDSPITACAVASLCGIIDINKRILLVDITDDGLHLESKKLILRDNILGLSSGRGSINEKLLAKDSNRKLLSEREIELTSSAITEISIYKPIRQDTRNVERAVKVLELSGSSKGPKQGSRLSARSDFLAEFFLKQELMDESRVVVMTGNAFYFLFNDKNYRRETFSEEKNRLLSVFLGRITILARMMPFHKSFLIQKLQENYIVAMVGDGLNDCGALKRADVGYSLGHSEASLSSAFSSQRESIKSFIDLLREGRVIVSTLKHTFKYISFMSILQFSSQIILSLFMTGLTDTQFLIQDLFVVTFLILACSTTSAEQVLSRQVPSFDMSSLENIIGFLGAICIQVSAQIGVIFWIRSLCDYQPCEEPNEIDQDIYGYNPLCQEAQAVFFLTLIIGINNIIITDTFRPHRKPFYLNWVFMIIFLFLNIYSHVAIFYEEASLAWFDIKYEILPLWKREVIVAVAWVTVAALFFFEIFIVRTVLVRLIARYKKQKLRGVVKLLSTTR